MDDFIKRVQSLKDILRRIQNFKNIIQIVTFFTNELFHVSMFVVQKKKQKKHDRFKRMAKFTKDYLTSDCFSYNNWKICSY